MNSFIMALVIILIVGIYAFISRRAMSSLCHYLFEDCTEKDRRKVIVQILSTVIILFSLPVIVFDMTKRRIKKM